MFPYRSTLLPGSLYFNPTNQAAFAGIPQFRLPGATTGYAQQQHNGSFLIFPTTSPAQMTYAPAATVQSMSFLPQPVPAIQPPVSAYHEGQVPAMSPESFMSAQQANLAAFEQFLKQPTHLPTPLPEQSAVPPPPPPPAASASGSDEPRWLQNLCHPESLYKVWDTLKLDSETAMYRELVRLWQASTIGTPENLELSRRMEEGLAKFLETAEKQRAAVMRMKNFAAKNVEIALESEQVPVEPAHETDRPREPPSLPRASSSRWSPPRRSRERSPRHRSRSPRHRSGSPRNRSRSPRNRSRSPPRRRSGERDWSPRRRERDEPRQSDRRDRTDSGRIPRSRAPRDEPSTSSPMRPPPPPPAPVKIETVSIRDLLEPPGRDTRPQKIVIIFRGIPGAGKTYLARLIKDAEVEQGGATPRTLSLDDYFMVENESIVKDPATGRRKKERRMEFEWDETLAPSYKRQLVKAFRKNVEDGFFPFLMVDAVNERVADFEPMWSVAKQNGFQVYIAEVSAELPVCVERNTNNFNSAHIEKLLKSWEPTPPNYIRLDLTSLIQDAAIEEVDMDDVPDEPAVEEGEKAQNSEESADPENQEVLDPEPHASKWDLLDSDSKLAKLDGLVGGGAAASRRTSGASDGRIDTTHGETTEDHDLLLTEYALRVSSNLKGRKRVRWADLEEEKKVEREKAIGFVVGQTDWSRIVGDYDTSKHLNRTKYI